MTRRLKKHLLETSAKTAPVKTYELYDTAASNRLYYFWPLEDGTMMVFDDQSGEWVKVSKPQSGLS